VERSADVRDARRNLIALTDKGRRAVELCGESFQAVDQRMLVGFSPEEKAQLTGFLTRMIDNLGGVEPPPFCPPEKEGEDRC
jgi:DNA-binding MarR family transcriptional regulator